MKTARRLLPALLAAGALAAGVQAQAATEMKFVMCGDQVRDADQAAIDAFMASNPDVNVEMEVVPWGTCQVKSMTLAAAGDPVSLAYMGSRTLKQLAEAGLIVDVDISPS